jgi:hypothetical protein
MGKREPANLRGAQAGLLTPRLADWLTRCHFQLWRKPRPREQNRAGEQEKNQRRAQTQAQVVRAVADGTDNRRRKGVAEGVNAEKVHADGRGAHRRVH